LGQRSYPQIGIKIHITSHHNGKAMIDATVAENKIAEMECVADATERTAKGNMIATNEANWVSAAVGAPKSAQARRAGRQDIVKRRGIILALAFSHQGRGGRLAALGRRSSHAHPGAPLPLWGAGPWFR
jgi:hypothetical protein